MSKEYEMDSYDDDPSEMEPRLYQTQLEEIAVKKNTIIHLPTGSGKTFIAVKLIKRFMNALKKPWGEGGKRTFFLVNTVPLVNQQKVVILRSCPLEVGGYSGEDRVDFWKKAKWDNELSKYHVIVMTSQILNDMLTHQYIRIQDINLIIFDECHHAVEDHPMRQIMKHFEACPTNEQPRILGLTATLLNSNVTLNKVEKTLQDLETTFHATIATVNEMGEVLKYSTNPEEKIIYYKAPSPTRAILDAKAMLNELIILIRSIKLPKILKNSCMPLRKDQTDITADPNKIIKKVSNMVQSMINHLDEMGAYGGTISVLAYIVLLERLKRVATSKEEMTLYAFTITHCTEVRMVLLDSMQQDKGYDKIRIHSSDKINYLLNILKEYNPILMNKNGVSLKINKFKKTLSAIIFTQERFTSKILYNLLNDVIDANPEDFGHLKHDFVVGFNVNPYNNTREQYYTKKMSHQALLKFKNCDLNCLISTRVIEEGVDVPQCHLIVRYDPPLDYRSYIQSKGRARSRESNFILLVNNEDQNSFIERYNAFQNIERRVHQLLMGNTSERAAPTEEDIQEKLYNDEIPPFVTENGVRLYSSSAISLLSRYCSVLPHDMYTLITPMWILEKLANEQRFVTIMMPIACPIKKPIPGEAFNNIKSAKRSAALNACVQLYNIGELEQDTMLPRKYGTINFEQEDVRQCFPNWPWDEPEPECPNLPPPGSKGRVRKHKKLYPSCLSGKEFHDGTQTFYLHLIKFDTAFEKPAESRERALYNLLKMDEGYGFLTMKPLPKLCDFPLFLTVGEVKTSIEMNYAVVELNVPLFELVRQFHFFIFDQVLEIAKKFLVFDGTTNGLYVVPVCNKGGFEIDWDVMKTYTEIKPVVVPTLKERRSVKVTRETYQNTVVTPWYRATVIPDRYIVSDVLEYMTPSSRFDSDSFESFADYYVNKYNLDIEGPPDQPLLEVRSITSRMNCLMPRAATIKAFTEKQCKLVSLAQGDDKPKGFNEVFIPEFCIHYDYPGVLWYKAVMLPSVVHRVTMLLAAHELRAEIAKATNYGQPNLQKGEEWLPLEDNLNVAMKSLLSQVEEPSSNNCIDRINDPIDENAPRPLNILTKKESIYQLQKQKLNKEYAWEETAEPIDIERNLSKVTLMDIECYDTFVMAPIADLKNLDTVRSPNKQPIPTAILPPPLRYKDNIELLSKTATGRGPELRDIVSALTSIKSHDTFNLERAETLGDSFLKFAATLYLFHKFPALDEGQLTNIKCKLIGNRNLYYAGVKKGLAGRMKVEHFSPRSDFAVPGFFAPKELIKFIEQHKIRPSYLIGMEFSLAEALSGNLSAESLKMVEQRFTDMNSTAEAEPEGMVQNAMQGYVGAQAVSDKSVADCVEAFIGTYLISGGIEGAVKILEWMKVIPPEDNFIQYLHKTVSTPIKEEKISEKEVDVLLNYTRDKIENILDYKFNDPCFLLEALSHPSYIRNRYTRSYERLEFLGDAILDFLITSHIFENCGDLKPGELTDLRSALVNNVTFASYVVKLGLHKFLLSNINPVLDNAILTFVEHQEQRDYEIQEDVLYLIDEEECQIAEYVEVPKAVSDIFESLVGAIYLDSKGCLDTVWRIVYRIMWKEIASFSQRVPKQPVRVLHEMVYACPNFEKPIETSTGVRKVMVPLSFSKQGQRHTVYGVGSNKFQAKRAASKLALKILAI
ncbi:endoribonuclease Dicer isoform X2 [Colias croceus]|uniref:endoribonuclease Dicer isoform X2 n=1 Tax=Colias crocea TaxID=72248 RepID=UPI001E280CD5|nr:endoribonuclease Dicer isoform X2 [Colias croceus]